MNVVNIFSRRKEKDKEDLHKISLDAIALAALINKNRNIPPEARLHFSENIDTLVDYLKKEVEKINKIS